MFHASEVRVTHQGISLVIPILNERDNIVTLIKSIMELPKNQYTARIREIILVDDGSDDGTVEMVRYLSNIYSSIPVVLIERKERYGTVNAQLCGIATSRFDTVLIMDGDLQHPVTYITNLIQKYSEGFDLVLASRYAKGGKATRTPVHGAISRGATLLAKVLLPWTRNLTDPISGFFIVNKNIVTNTNDVFGYNKLALYILSSRSKVSSAEIPFSFVERSSGHSKVASDGLAFIMRYIAELKFYRTLKRFNKNTYSSKASRSKRETFWNH